MKGTTILAVTNDAEWLVAMRPALTEAGRWRLVVAETLPEAGQLLEYTNPDMVVVDWGGGATRTDGLELLLWKNSIQKRQIPIVIVSADYKVDEATLFFQLGVSEYLSQADHRDVLGRILATHSPAAAQDRACALPPAMDADESDLRALSTERL
jgi:DNA-binding response OmpR family regulator